MPELNPEIAAEVADACKAGAEEAAAAFGRVLDVEATLAVGEPGSLDPRVLVEGGGAGALVVVLKVGGQGALVVLPESSALVPAWCADPEPAGERKLAMLARVGRRTLAGRVCRGRFFGCSGRRFGRCPHSRRTCRIGVDGAARTAYA